MWYPLPYAVTIVSILINCVTFLALLYPPKPDNKRLQQRLRYGICVILVVGLSLYTGMMQSSVLDTHTADLACSIGSILVHCLMLTATIWVFLENLNGAYDTMGYEKRIKGVGLNKIVITLHLAPLLVLFISMIHILVEYEKTFRIEVDGFMVKNGSQNTEGLGDSCWVDPITYWITWNIPAIALFLLTLLLCFNIAKPYKISRLLSWSYKGDEIKWVRHTVAVTFFFTATVVTASFADAESSYGRVPHQCFFSASFFLFSLTTFYCWVLSPPEVYYFWRYVTNNISINCLTCGWCIIDYGVAREMAGGSMTSSLYVNNNKSTPDLDEVSIASSSCSGPLCRHVNQKCLSGAPTVLEIDDKTADDPEISGVDRKRVNVEVLEFEGDEMLSEDLEFLARHGRTRTESKVSFSDIVIVNDFGPAEQADIGTQVNVVFAPKSILRSSTETTPVMSDPRVHYLSNEPDMQTGSPSPTETEKAANLEKVVAGKTTKVNHVVVMDQLLNDFETRVGGGVVGNVYTPASTGSESSSFSEHLKTLMQEFEARPGAVIVKKLQQPPPDEQPCVIVPGYNPGLDQAPPPPRLSPSPVPPQTFDVLFPLRDSSGENTPTQVNTRNSDSDSSFGTPMGGSTPDLLRGDPTASLRGPELEQAPVESPVNFLRKVFGGRNAESPSPSLE